MSNPNRRGPRALSEILGELFTVRGYGRLRASRELEGIWNTAVGEPSCHQTRVGDVRHGVLSVTVSHPTLLEELAAFRKPELLQALRAGAPGMTIHDIRFRVGRLDAAAAPLASSSSPLVSEKPPPRARKPPAPSDRRRKRSQTRGNEDDRATGNG